MSNLKLFELVSFCNDNNIDKFIFDSSYQPGDRYSMMCINSDKLDLYVNESDGYIALKNETVLLKLHDVSYIRINRVNPLFGVVFDIICNGDTNNIHRVIGKYKCLRGNDMRETNCTCNFCGKPMDDFDINLGFSFNKTMGYGSEYDGDKINLNLCCSCVDNLIKKSKVNPVKG